MSHLAGKHIVLGLSGGIAAFKSAELCRALVKAGATVQVVMTEAAEHFMTAVTMQALSGRPVYTSQWDAREANNMAHINLSREADAIVVAPASADFMAKLLHGRADELLSLMCLARPIDKVPLIVAPAMNREMWANPATQRNVAQLKADGIHVLDVGQGDQACGETGDGRMLEAEEILEDLEAFFTPKVLAGKRKADVLRLDFTQIRPAGQRLRGYGWISSGDETFAPAMQRIAEVLNKKAGQLLSRIDILDLLNHLGTTLSSRRSAEIALVPHGDPEWVEFAKAKKDFWVHNNFHRQQSNNSVMFKSYPTHADITQLFDLMQEAGGSEPGFINMVEGKRRAPWISGVNPCAEILLPNKGFCNLVEINLSHFNGKDIRKLWRTVQLLARANYRQTCVNLVDGVLQRAWHENNEFLRLCGVGITGVAEWEYADDPTAWQTLKLTAKTAAYKMADELGLPRPKAVTTVKPSGTLSKIMDTTEGVHKPLGKFIFNNVRFSKHDPYVEKLIAANYRVFQDPSSPDAVLVTFPVAYENVKFDEVDGKFVNLEPATVQLDRYKLLMDHYVDHNCSVTISYSPEEAPEIVDWLADNWNNYVGVSFLYRTDPTKTAKDLGYLYLPQQVVTKEDYDAYMATLRPLNGQEMGAQELVREADDFEIDTGMECATGACPIR